MKEDKTMTTTSKHLSPVYQGRDKEADARPAATSQQTEQRKPPSKKLTPYEPEWLWDYDYFMIAHR